MSVERRTYFIAEATMSASGVVGRPSNVESWRPQVRQAFPANAAPIGSHDLAYVLEVENTLFI